MFTKINPTAVSQLSNEGVANLIVDDAINKMAQLTGLSQEKVFALLANQLSQHSHYVSRAINHAGPVKAQAPLLEQSESLFISSLFN